VNIILQNALTKEKRNAKVAATLDQHTLGHLECQACEHRRTLAMQATPIAEMTFHSASEEWLLQHKRYIAERTYGDYQQYLKPLREFFRMNMREIHIGHIREYQDWRAEKAGATRINMEGSTLQQILKEANLWEPMAPHYKPLPIPKAKCGRPLNPEQEAKLRRVCLSKPKWRLAGHCLLIMANTTCGFGELRMVKREDVDLHSRLLHIQEGAKNDFRVRTIPLNETALRSIQWLVERWEGLGGKLDTDFLLPHRAHKRGEPTDFDRPMGSIKGAFGKIRAEIGLPKLRIYDMRVHAITKLLSNPKVSTQTAKEIAGHISQAMQDRYSHQLTETKREAMSVLDSPAISTEKLKIVS
jgi:integrase